MHKISDSVRSMHGQDGAVVLDVQRGQIFNLNPVGSRILALVEVGSSEPVIVNVISREFDADRMLVENDVREFIEILRKHDLLKESNRTDSVTK